MEKVSMDGKSLLVIGGSSDVGMACIRKLSGRYDRVIAHYRHMNDGLQALKGELGDKLVCLQADLADEVQVQGLIDAIKCTPPQHIIHFPAPLCENQRFHKIAWNVFQGDIDVSLKSLVLILQAFLPGMVRVRYGKIAIMLSFVVDGTPPAYRANYVATKYALWGLVKALSAEYASKGITINGVSPSWIQTKFNVNQPHVFEEKNAEANPLGRNLVPEDVVPAFEYLLSDGADCVNGQNISITCGR